MLTVSKLNLQVSPFYRCEHPRGVYNLTFELDPRSEYLLIEEARKLSTNEDVRKFEEGVVDAAISMICKMPGAELESGNVAEMLRSETDREFTGRLFAYQIKPSEEKNHFVVTKAKAFDAVCNVITPQEVPDEPLVSAINFDPQIVSTSTLTAPISVRYLLGEGTAFHLEEVASRLSSRDEIEELGRQIRKLVRLAAHKMVNNRKIYKPQGTNIKWKYTDEESGREFAMLFTIINEKRFLVRKIRIS